MRKESYTFAEYNQEREAVIKESQYKEKYKNALKEIKKITNKTLWTYSNLDDVTKYNMFDKILQKINEVLNA